MKLFSFVFLFTLVSCGTFERKGAQSLESARVNMDFYSPLRSPDYVDHLSAYEDFYIGSSEVRLKPLLQKEEAYLESLGMEIIKNNELFFTSGVSPRFKVVESDVPFHFSLPGMKVFISSGLVEKYIKSEKLLYAVVAYELIRSEKRIYKKTQIVPTGYMPTSRILSLLRLSTEEKVETHKWAYYTLKRVGLDTDIYLSWLQIQNRNSSDFALQLGDTSSISREESLFKAFVIQSAQEKNGRSKYERSSKEFYSFVNRIKR